MHRSRQRYSTEWHKMMPTPITTGIHRHHHLSLFDDDDCQYYEHLQSLSEKEMLSSLLSGEEHRPTSNREPPETNCCSSTSVSRRSPLTHPSHYCPVQAITALVSSLSRDVRRTRSATLAPPAAAVAAASSRGNRPQKSRRGRTKTSSGSFTSPSSEWLKLTSSRQNIAQPSPDSPNIRPFDVLTRDAQAKNADDLDYGFTMADPASVDAGAHPAICPMPTVTALTGSIANLRADITLIAFETTYVLHRSILERAPYFSAMLSGQWNENSDRVISLFPAEMDPNITRVGFEVALEYMYGRNVMNLIELDPIGIFTVCQWLELTEPLKWAAQTIMHHLDISNIHSVLSVFIENHYGREGQVVLDAAKSLLRLRGYEMPLAVWDHIPAELVREIVGGDSFFISSELKRWEYAVSLLDRVLEANALKMRIPFLDDNGSAPLHVTRELEGLLPLDALETDTDMELDTNTEQGLETSRQFSEVIHNQWLSLYTHPDVLPIRKILTEDIAYMHIPLEHFRAIQSHRDIFGVRPVQPAVIHSAFVQALKLGHLVNTADEFNLKLNIGRATFVSEFPAAQRSQIQRFHRDSGLYPCTVPSGDVICREYPVSKEDKMTANLTVSRKARGFMHNGCNYHPQHQRFRANYLVMGWDRSDLVKLLPMNPQIPYPENSPFPPFRFSTSFPHPSTLDKKQRLFAPPFWYAGATWALYLCHNALPKASRVGLYLRRIYDTCSVEPSLDSWSSRLNPPLAAHQDPLSYNTGLANPYGNEMSPNYNQAYLRLHHVENTLGTRDATGQLPVFPPLLGSARTLPYVDCRSAVTAYFTLYSNFACAGQPACFQSKPEQFQVDRCWGWDVRVPDGHEQLLDLCGNPLNERQLKICLVIGG
ncbi:hypothetical protein AJ78_03560 [Emergomyces pasteurianus Ep9510]|uniref:BTB domain-containing protein n=1 Tax=Emergomyces pasteurianus Ep9510 TaxID=1447872 RepID=A0A1J9QM38_9EURO|nr:hypothetical protein AJ78_03560 [Emergomyces pasteurianus Ep9510]